MNVVKCVIVIVTFCMRRLMVVASDMEYFERMAQLHLLHSTSYLLTELVPVSKADTILPRTLKNSLSSSLLDASFGRLYPAAHESLVQYVNVNIVFSYISL